MQYSDIRDKITTGDIIGFCHGHKPVGKIVQLVTRSPYTHVATAWVTDGRVYVFEAVQPLVRIFPLSKLTPFYWVKIPGGLNEDALEFANSIVGERYSLMDCIRSVTGDTTDDNRWQCAEMTREIQRRNGRTVKYKATPRDMITWGSIFNKPILIEG